MNSSCVECGNRTYKGFAVCSYCRTGHTRIERQCFDCGSTIDVRIDPRSPPQLRCPPCREASLVQIFISVASPIFYNGGTHADIGRSLGVSRERVRQIIKANPVINHLRRITLGERRVGMIRPLLDSGEIIQVAAKHCGFSEYSVKGILKTHPELRSLAQRNRLLLKARRFDPIFELVEREGMSISMACRILRIKCRMAIYEIARLASTQARFPALQRVPRRQRAAQLTCRRKQPGFQNAG